MNLSRTRDLDDLEKTIFSGCTTADQDLSFSETVWGFRWSRFFPYTIPESNVVVEISNHEIFLNFAKENSDKIFGQSFTGSPFLWFESSAAKTRYYEKAGDFFVFKKEGKVIGIFVGTLSDWSTYYLRNVSILPESQRQGIFQKFVSYYLDCLEELEVARVEGEVSPNNSACLKLLLKLGFYVSGVRLSERWGALTHLTKVLCPKHRSVFLNQFCHLKNPKEHGASGID